MHDSQEESYSMYPKTSSPPPPPQANMHFPVYQTPVMYGYSQNPYMYAGQAPGYHFGMMNQGQMMYQPGAGMPQQANGGVGGSKKKWNMNNMGSGNSSANLSNGKTHNYHNSSHAASYHPQTTNNSGSGKSYTPTITDPFKFDCSKIKNEGNEEMMEGFPVFLNTNDKEFVEARAKRYDLRLKALQIDDGLNFEEKEKKTEVNIDKKETKMAEQPPVEEIVNDIKPEKLSQTKAAPTEDGPLEEKEEEKVTNSIEEPVREQSPPENAENVSPTPSEESTTPYITPAPTPKPAAKSWSAVASSALSRGKQSSIVKPVSRPNSAQPQALPHQQQQPQKKAKKYVPATPKGVEPLGSIALRMCFDPDYVSYTLDNAKSEDKLPIKSIIPRGIINSANICFMSSVLQVLLYCTPFVDILNVVSTRNMSAKVGNTSTKLLDACLTIYKKFDKETYEKEKQSEKEINNQNKEKTSGKKSPVPAYASSTEAVKPDEFYRTLSTLPKFRDLQWGHQEDAEEFLTHLLDQLHEELVSAIDGLTDNEIQNLLQSIHDDDLRIYIIRNLSRYKDAEFSKNMSAQLKEQITKYGVITDDNNDESGWHEVSVSSKKGKKTKTAAKRTVEVIPSPVSNLFGGQFRSVLDIPQNKESQSITLDPFQTIQLDISDPAVNDLESAFKKFSEFELLPFKSSSGNDVEAKKQTFIDKLPQVLLIQLKRFSFISNTGKDNGMTNYNAYSGRIEKIRKKVAYGHTLTIPNESIAPTSARNNESRTYELSGVIYHHGMSPDGGHYTADVYHKDSSTWYRIDDVNITKLKDDDVLKGGEDNLDTRTAYILMYQNVHG
ncbi:mRNA-binding ubiquitin-specific protease UBP3 RNJ42_03436 [Nakaseomyces bracarensis]|uniref:mRNA-binding ubiquitin-specific protease UBP3 n=1 Tax=Nakaseomyces bracarensis TaxID=273131 RepID=UPI003870F5AE